MAKRRKLWSELAQSTRDRYSKAGVTARQYNSGNIPASAKAKATGRKPKAPRTPGHVYTSKARGVKKFSELSPKRQEQDISRIMRATGASRSEARRLLTNAHKRGEILRTGPVIGPATARQAEQGYYANTVYHNISAAKGRAFFRMDYEDRSKLARNWAASRRQKAMPFLGDDIPDWPYPDELDAEGWKAYQEAVS